MLIVLSKVKSVLRKQFTFYWGNLRISIKDLAKASYVIGVCHDINDNNKLDKNFFGLPLERYRFSKSIRGYKLKFNEPLSIFLNSARTTQIELEKVFYHLCDDNDFSCFYLKHEL